MRMTTGIILVVLILTIVNSVLIFRVTFENQSHSNPSFLTQTKSGYMITYSSGNCVTALTLHQENGGIWVEDGHGECATSTNNSSNTSQTPNFFEKACYSVLANGYGAQIGFKTGLHSYKDTNDTGTTYIGVLC